jgi:hypothetical protein
LIQMLLFFVISSTFLEGQSNSMPRRLHAE